MEFQLKFDGGATLKQTFFNIFVVKFTFSEVFRWKKYYKDE